MEWRYGQVGFSGKGICGVLALLPIRVTVWPGWRRFFPFPGFGGLAGNRNNGLKINGIR